MQQEKRQKKGDQKKGEGGIIRLIPAGLSLFLSCPRTADMRCIRRKCRWRFHDAARLVAYPSLRPRGKRIAMVRHKGPLLLAECINPYGGIDRPSIEHVARQRVVDVHAPVIVERDQMVVE